MSEDPVAVQQPPKGLPGFAPGPGAQPEALPHPEWNPRWRKAGFWDAVVTSAGAILYVAESQIELGGNGADWLGPILWDDAVRDALRFKLSSGRKTAGTISDLMMIGSLVHNALLDNLLVAWAIHGEPELAWQMSLMNAEAYAIALSMTSLVKAISSRARPMVEECRADPLYSPDCQSLDQYRSFFSGHSAVTAVGAGLLCAHHLSLPLYDGGLLDAGTCAMGIALTMATGAMRIASDNHWATDVTTGHLVGFASGFLVPMLLYYNERDPGQAGSFDRRVVLLPSVGPDQVGVQVVGSLL
ncbi:MAG: phosphatase PAP2 family protein [Myxococcales bacterium]|nr:phosphatase PAP2 family protein [Myxococcales bacterium]MDD9967373.1 phosphatase PAP2 family protein [Myxococcales bacterium]